MTRTTEMFGCPAAAEVGRLTKLAWVVAPDAGMTGSFLSDPSMLLLAVLHGRELGWEPAECLRQLALTAALSRVSPQALDALVVRAGCALLPVDAYRETVTVTCRCGNGDELPYSYTLDWRGAAELAERNRLDVPPEPEALLPVTGCLVVCRALCPEELTPSSEDPGWR